MPSYRLGMSPEDATSTMVARVVDAQRRFETAIAELDDAAVRRATELPGWTVGHLLTHVARNADSHVRRAEAAVLGQTVEQYAGGQRGRDQAIEAGSLRDARTLIADVSDSAERLRLAWRDLPRSAWSVVTRDVRGRERELRELPARRWQELEVHVVDLGLGVTPLDWSADFVAFWLPRLRDSMAARLPPGTPAPGVGDLSERQELAWLYGRDDGSRRADLPRLLPWV